MKFSSTFISILFTSSCWNVVNAIYIDGMVRLFRGDGNHEDSINGYHADNLQGSGQSFATETLPTSGAEARQVMYFNGNGRAVGDATGTPEGDESRTILGWFKIDSSSTGQGPFGYGDAAENAAYFPGLVHANSEMFLEQWITNSGIRPVMSNFAGITWYHVACSYDASTNRNTAYINGSFVKSGTPSSRPNTQLARIAIGGNPNSDESSNSGTRFKGYVADFAVFNKVLSAAEVASIYDAPEGLTPPCSTNSDCTSNYCGTDGACTDGSNGSSCLDAQSCTSTFCAGSTPVCTNGQIGTVCDTGENDCDTGLECDSSSNTCKASSGTVCSGGSDCISGLSCLSSNQVCTDGANTSACDSSTDCAASLSCLGNTQVCSDGANGSPCDTSNDCTSEICFGGSCSSGSNGSSCGSGSDCASGYCSPTSNSCATRPILDPCHGISCSNHGKCKGNGVCQCEDTFIQTNNGKDCGCPGGSFLNVSVNRCYAPTVPLTSSPTSMPVTSAPTLLITPAPTTSPTATFENPVCKDDSFYKFELKRVAKEVDCFWISKNKKRVEKRRSKYCTEDFDDGALISACKKSCNLC